MTKQERLAVEAEAKRLAEVTGGDPDEFMELAKLGFEESKVEEHFRLIMSSSALEKTGKTHFAVDAVPDPIAYVNLDDGEEGVLNKFRHKKIITTKLNRRQEKVLEGEAYTMDDAEDEWGRAHDIMRAVVKSSSIRTVVFDTATDLWEIARIAEHGKLKEVMPQQYSNLNAKFRAFMKLPYLRTNLNCVFIHKVKKEYKGKNWSGEYERQGFNEIGFLVQVNVEHFRVDEDEDEDRPFGIRILDCRQNGDLVGDELIGPMCNFRALARMVHPNSKKQDWE